MNYLPDQTGASKNKSKFQKLIDAELVLMLQNPETKNEAMKELMSKHHPDIWRICYSYLHNRVLVEDAEEETWMLAYIQITEHKYHEEAHFAQWIHRIAHNCSVEMGKHEGIYNHKESALKVMLFRSAGSRRIPEWDDKFYTLPQWVQRVLQKRVIEGRSVKETAADLHITDVAVRKACRMALKLLGDSEYESGEIE